MPLAAGSRLGVYEIRGLLGAGGMGEVYEAFDTRLRRRVALKVLQSAVIEEGWRDRFEQEARTLAALTHPGIVTIYSVEDADGVSFLTMELVEGTPLASRIPRGGMPLSALLDVAVPLADAVGAAHASGVTHRDLKPANVLVTSDGRVKVLDFGLAKLHGHGNETASAVSTLPTQLTVEGQILGTVSYMSPEQAQGKPVDARSDLFSLGVVLYELATGSRPFTGDGSIAVMSAILRDTPPLVTDSRPDLPPALARVIRRCLEKDPGRRLQTAVDLRNELEEIKGGRAASREATPARWSRGLAAVAAVLMLATLAGVAWWWRSGTGTADRIDSVAVLPFVNASGNADAEYLSSGITETLTNSLSRIDSLRVVPRTLAAKYRNNAADPSAAGRELGVRAIVTGQVVQRGDRLLVQAELVDVTSVAQLWGEQFDRPLSDALRLQDDLSRAIVTGLRRRLTDEDEENLAVGTSDELAYQLYLKGQDRFNGRSMASLAQATEFFEQATARDPSYATAFVGLSRAYGTRANLGGLPPNQGYPRAIAAARHAIELDDGLAEAHATIAVAVMHFEWDFEEAGREFERALRLGPEDANVRALYGAFWLRFTKRLDEAVAMLSSAAALDPLSATIPTQLGNALAAARRYDEAIVAARRALSMDKDSSTANRVLSLAYRRKNMPAEALEASRAMIESGDPRSGVYLALGYAAAGQKAEATTQLNALMSEVGDSAGRSVLVAGVHAALGSKDRAFAWLERAYREHDPTLAGLASEPELESLRDDPRFASLVKRIGIPVR